MENAEKSDSESSSELDDDEYAEKLRELHELQAKAETKENTMKDEEDKEEEEESDDEEDEEVKEMIVEYTLYYSPLDLMHELYYIKKKLEELARRDMTLYKQLEQGLSKEELESFHKAMTEADKFQKEIEEENA